eukprot:scaffold8.g1523.t1
MPAPRGRANGQQLSDQLAAAAPTRPVNNLISLDKYYRSARLLLRQAQQYREHHNQEQLYVMLMRFVSLVVETLPHHRSYLQSDADYQALRKRVLNEAFPELERLKVELNLKGNRAAAAELEARPYAPTKTAGTTLLQAGNLPELAWAGSLAPLPAAAPAVSPLGVPQPDGFDLLASPPPGDYYSSGAAAGGSSYDGLGSAAAALVPPASMLPDLGTSIRLPSASHAALSRHAVLPMGSFGAAAAAASSYGLGPTEQQQLAAQQQQQRRVQYPQLDLGRSEAAAAAGSSAGLPVAASSVEAALASLDVGQQQQQQQWEPYPAPSPYGELGLGPQEVAVHTVPAPTQPPAPGESCCMPAAAAVPAGGLAEVRKRQSLRDVHVSVALMDEFMRYALSNTRRNVETCGVLGAVLSPDDSILTITTLIIPKQQGTSDTVEMLHEEEMIEVCEGRQAYTLGWIHTHPAQTCFLSSVDVHTQANYQGQMDEAVSIVMAPRDPDKRVGVFRLSTPSGLDLVQACDRRGFHMHPPTPTGQPLYELCGHVYLNPRAKFEVVDLR